MGKDEKKGTPRRPTIEEELARYRTLKFWQSRDDWLNGRAPITPMWPTWGSVPRSSTRPTSSPPKPKPVTPVQADVDDQYVHTAGPWPKITGPLEDRAANITEGRRLARLYLQEQPEITDDQIRFKLEQAGIKGEKPAIRRMIIEHVLPKRDKRR